MILLGCRSSSSIKNNGCLSPMAEAKRGGRGDPGQLFVSIIIPLHCLQTGPYKGQSYVIYGTSFITLLPYMTIYVIHVLVV